MTFDPFSFTIVIDGAATSPKLIFLLGIFCDSINEKKQTPFTIHFYYVKTYAKPGNPGEGGIHHMTVSTFS